MINLDEYKKDKYEKYRKEVEEILQKHEHDGEQIETALNTDEFRFHLGLEPVIDHMQMLLEICMQGTSLQAEIAMLNRKYGYTGNKIHEK